jgi:TonB family protein
MQTFLQRNTDPSADSPADSVIELSPHSRLPRLDLGIDWESTREEFPTSLRAVFTGPRPPKDSEMPKDRVIRAHWIRGKKPGWAFAAACLLQACVIGILILPIWGFLPDHTPTLAPIQIETTWYGEPPDLPRISLPAAARKAIAPPKRRNDSAKAEGARGADAFHPRQTILSIPVRVTHPRQTLIQPNKPTAPPKIATPLPDIVQWSATEIAKPKFQLSTGASTPKIKRRTVKDAAAPDVPSVEKNAGSITIVANPTAIPRPKMPLSAMSPPIASRQAARTDAVAAPEIGSTAEGDASLHRVIALSATPAPPAPAVSLPEGNLAARISISPEGAKPGTPGGSANRSVAANGGATGNAGSTIGRAPAAGTGSNTGSLPAAVSISGGEAHARNGGSGGIAPAGNRPGKLNLKPEKPYQPSSDPRKGLVNVAALDPGLPPEKILSGSEVYTLHIDLPNLTSASGSWIINFSELDETKRPLVKQKDPLAAPVPVEKSDPKYPPELIKAHVQGEVVLYAIIRKDGSVDSIQVVRSLDPQLDRNAMNALAEWKFLPATRAGVPVALEAVIHIPFLYRDPRDLGPR